MKITLSKIFLVLFLCAISTNFQCKYSFAETLEEHIKILKFESGKGNFFYPKVTATVRVSGQDISVLKLLSVSSSGQFNRLQTFPVKQGENISFRAKYLRTETDGFEFRLYDNKGNVIARKSLLPE